MRGVTALARALHMAAARARATTPHAYIMLPLCQPICACSGGLSTAQHCAAHTHAIAATKGFPSTHAAAPGWATSLASMRTFHCLQACWLQLCLFSCPILSLFSPPFVLLFSVPKTSSSCLCCLFLPPSLMCLWRVHAETHPTTVFIISHSLLRSTFIVHFVLWKTFYTEESRTCWDVCLKGHYCIRLLLLWLDDTAAAALRRN